MPGKEKTGKQFKMPLPEKICPHSVMWRGNRHRPIYLRQ